MNAHFDIDAWIDEESQYYEALYAEEAAERLAALQRAQHADLGFAMDTSPNVAHVTRQAEQGRLFSFPDTCNRPSDLVFDLLEDSLS